MMVAGVGVAGELAQHVDEKRLDPLEHHGGRPFLVRKTFIQSERSSVDRSW